jgi:hypothetical protein
MFFWKWLVNKTIICFRINNGILHIKELSKTKWYSGKEKADKGKKLCNRCEWLSSIGQLLSGECSQNAFTPYIYCSDLNVLWVIGCGMRNGNLALMIFVFEHNGEMERGAHSMMISSISNSTSCWMGRFAIDKLWSFRERVLMCIRTSMSAGVGKTPQWGVARHNFFELIHYRRHLGIQFCEWQSDIRFLTLWGMPGYTFLSRAWKRWRLPWTAIFRLLSVGVGTIHSENSFGMSFVIGYRAFDWLVVEFCWCGVDELNDDEREIHYEAVIFWWLGGGATGFRRATGSSEPIYTGVEGVVTLDGWGIWNISK